MKKEIKHSVFDFVILFAKFYLYQCRMENCLPRIDIYRKKLKYRYDIELYNAKVTMSQSTFISKWVLYECLLPQS